MIRAYLFRKSKAHSHRNIVRQAGMHAYLIFVSKSKRDTVQYFCFWLFCVKSELIAVFLAFGIEIILLSLSVSVVMNENGNMDKKLK